MGDRAIGFVTNFADIGFRIAEELIHLLNQFDDPSRHLLSRVEVPERAFTLFGIEYGVLL